MEVGLREERWCERGGRRGKMGKEEGEEELLKIFRRTYF